MGLIVVDGTVTGPAGDAKVSFLVDSGAAYTLLPEATWRAIGLVPKRTQVVTLADGTSMTRLLCSRDVVGLRPDTTHVAPDQGDGGARYCRL